MIFIFKNIRYTEIEIQKFDLSGAKKYSSLNNKISKRKQKEENEIVSLF